MQVSRLLITVRFAGIYLVTNCGRNNVQIDILTLELLGLSAGVVGSAQTKVSSQQGGTGIG